MKPTAFLLCCLLAPALSSCGGLQDKPGLLDFSLRHPAAALAIGSESPHGTNITSNAVRLSTRLGLDNRANGDGRGTEVNALRHSLWQAAISARFGADIAEQVGNAYERDSTLRPQSDYPNRYRADEAADLRNNAIGRRIGQAHHGRNMNELAALLLAEYREHGLWTASAVTREGQTVWRIAQTRLSEARYRQALQKLAALDRNGMTEAERRQLRTRQ